MLNLQNNLSRKSVQSIKQNSKVWNLIFIFLQLTMNAQMSVCESSPFEMSDSIYNMNAKPNDDSIFNLNSNSRFEETFPARQEFYENEESCFQPRQQSLENERFQPSQESFEIENFYQQQSFEEQPYIDENQVCLTNDFLKFKLQVTFKT